jgi:tetratricopeptide (TPR) repeat protein
MLSSVNPWVAQGTDNTLLKGILDDTAKRLAAGEIKDELIAADLHAVIGSTYFSLGLYHEAEQHIPIALEIRKRRLGERDPATLQSDRDEIILIQNMARGGRSALAPRIHRNYELHLEVLGPDHPDTIRAKTMLTGVFGSTGRRDEAERNRREVLADWKRVLGPDHPVTLHSMADLANMCAVRGNYDEAESLLLEALDISKSALSDNDPATLDMMGYTARLYELLGRYSEAEPYRLGTVDVSSRVLGEQHPFTLFYRTKLGSFYVMMEKYDEAIAQFELDVRNRRRIEGMDEAGTWIAMRNLADAYVTVGRHDDALALYQELIEVLPDNSDEGVATHRDFLAAWIFTRDDEELRDPKRAIECAKRAVAMGQKHGRRGVYRYFATGVHEYLNTLALAQYQAGDTEQAIATQKRAIKRITPLADQTVRTTFEANLRTYENALAEQNGQ